MNIGVMAAHDLFLSVTAEVREDETSAQILLAGVSESCFVVRDSRAVSGWSCWLHCVSAIFPSFIFVTG